MGDLADHRTVILNETTQTVHKRKGGESQFHSVCGITYHVDQGHLRETTMGRASESLNVTKCGRCFEGSGGY